jgi:type IV secretion system protein VirD4
MKWRPKLSNIRDIGLSVLLMAAAIFVLIHFIAPDPNASIVTSANLAPAPTPGPYVHPFNWRQLWPVIWGWRLIQIGLAGAVGFVLGALFSHKLKPVRRLIWMGLAALILALSIFAPPPLSDYAGWLVKPVIFLLALAYGLRLGAAAAAAARRRRPRPTSYGSAKWATFDYLTANKLFAEGGFYLGQFREAGRTGICRYDGARHLLTVAPTRSGKGVSSIIPNLLLHEGSALVIDPKGENALITAKRRGAGDPALQIEGMGQKIVLLDPWNVAASRLGLEPAHFNPLDWITDGDADAAENAFLLADALVIESGGSGETPFWDEEAKALLTGIILYVATGVTETGNRHLGRVRDILTLDDVEFDKVLERMFNHPNPLVSSTASRTAAKEMKLRSSVLASAQAHTHFLESPRIRESLSKSDFSFADLKTTDITVYLILPADRLNTFNRWMRLLIQQAITVSARDINVKPKRPVLIMLDEMPTLGRLPSLEQAYGLMAGFGIQLWGIVQDLSQLAKVYGEHGWQTFIANSGVIQYFGSRDKMTAEYFSSLCGVTTIEVHNFSWAVGQAISIATNSSSSYGAGGGSGSSGSSTSTTDNWTRTHGTNEAQRQLAYPDELMVMKGEDQIVFVENLDPIVAAKVVWFDDPVMKKMGVDLQLTPLAAPTAEMPA